VVLATLQRGGAAIRECPGEHALASRDRAVDIAEALEEPCAGTRGHEFSC